MTEEQLVTFLKELGVTRIVTSGGNVRGCCPIHGEDRPSFGVSVHKDGHPWNCFSCGNSGLTIRSLCAKIWPEKSRQEIARIIDSYGGAAVIDVPERVINEEQVYAHWFRAFPVQSVLRDLDAETLQEAEIREYEDGAVLVPYFVGDDLSGVIVYNWGKDTPVKSFSLYGFKNRQHVFRPKMCKTNGNLVIVEGVYDALKVYDSGADNVVAIGGAMITKNQRKEIAQFSDTCLVVMPDKDQGGEVLLNSVIKSFPSHAIFVADSYDGNDPGDSSYASIAHALRNKRMVL